MKFIFADSHDFIDPGFDFEAEEYSADRRAQHDDIYPHEYFDAPPYDGILVSRATVGDERTNGKYSTSQSLRFRRDGAAKYLRYDPASNGGTLMGDCGAFSYVQEENPPYSVEDTFDFYAECGFTHGVSIDHAILGYNEVLDGPSLFDPKRDAGTGVPEEYVRRFDITMRLAGEFREYCRDHNAPFEAIGVAQGWSPKSYASAVRHLTENLGYSYVALGGMVPLKADQIRRCLDAVRQVAPHVKIHIFGFTKADDLDSFAPFDVESFDSTSPMLRAFKDGTRNYRLDRRWYTAIRIPQADEERNLKQSVLAGRTNQKQLRLEEAEALEAVRRCSEGSLAVDEALEAVTRYSLHMLNGKSRHLVERDPRAAAYRTTLEGRPWAECPCKICKDVGVEVIIFRGSNRNRRRGFHNLWQFHEQVRRLRDPQSVSSK
jgi:hypothetical protein